MKDTNKSQGPIYELITAVFKLPVEKNIKLNLLDKVKAVLDDLKVNKVSEEDYDQHDCKVEDGCSVCMKYREERGLI